MSDEASGEHQQHHQQFGPGEPAAAHFYLKILDTGNFFKIMFYFFKLLRNDTTELLKDPIFLHI